MQPVPELPSRRQSAFAGLVALGAAIALLAIPEPSAQTADAIHRDADRQYICEPGYARAIRPPEAVMERIKERMCEDRTRTMIGDNGHQVRECLRTNELDHIIPLCLDGAPLDPANLQLQPWSDARKKDERERNACRLYCRGEVDMPAALQIVRGND